MDNVDIHLERPSRTVLEGTVKDETSRPVSGAFVVAHRSDMSFDLIPAYTDEEGNYEMSCLGRGEFLVHVNAIQYKLVRTSSAVEIDGAGPARLDFVLRRGVRISGRLVDEQGSAWEVDRGLGFARIQNYPNTSTGGFSLTGFFNKNSTKNVQDHQAESFHVGEGDYAGSLMVFPTKSTFVFEGVMAGNTLIKFEPKKENQVVKRILYNGQDITESGLLAEPGDEIEGVTIVIGNET